LKLLLLSNIKWLIAFIKFTALDFVLVGLNLISAKKNSPSKRLGEYVKPSNSDSRSPCPALNALANHGYFPQSGRGITWQQLARGLNEVYNISPSFINLTLLHWWTLKGMGENDTLDLGDLCLHNAIEHDASITREDFSFQPDQSKPDQELVDRLLNSATGDGGKTLTVDDLSRFTAIRRVECRKRNRNYTECATYNFFSSNNAGTLVDVFGGHVDDLRIFLKEERIPDGWQSYEASAYGLTQGQFAYTIFMIDSGIDTDSVNQSTMEQKLHPSNPKILFAKSIIFQPSM